MMDLENFYTGFGILLVYFALVWQNIRQDSKAQIKNSKILIEKQSTTASDEQIKNQRESLWHSIGNPLNITISIISISGTLAFYKIICANFEKIAYNVESIVLISIAFMHLVISTDLWIINFGIIHKIFKMRELKK